MQLNKAIYIMEAVFVIKLICQLLQMHCNLRLILQVLSPYSLPWSIRSKLSTSTILLTAFSCCPTYSTGRYCNLSIAATCIIRWIALYDKLEGLVAGLCDLISRAIVLSELAARCYAAVHRPRCASIRSVCLSARLSVWTG